ncbi:hypothetical protein OAF54_02810 [bacterium]|nr:hypothetical protein [bacterium]
MAERSKELQKWLSMNPHYKMVDFPGATHQDIYFDDDGGVTISSRTEIKPVQDNTDRKQKVCKSIEE